jgi:hypothetical protein
MEGKNDVGVYYTNASSSSSSSSSKKLFNASTYQSFGTILTTSSQDIYFPKTGEI